MKWLTAGGISDLERLRREHDDHGFLLHGLAAHILEPATAASELASWDPEDIRVLAVGWAEHPYGLDRTLDDDDTAQAFGRAFDASKKDRLILMSDAISPMLDAIRRQNREMTTLLGPSRVFQDLLRAAEVARSRWESTRGQHLIHLPDNFALSKAAFAPLQVKTDLASSLAAAMAQSAQLRPLVPDLSSLTEAFRVAASHHAMISQFAVEHIGWQPTIDRLTAGLQSLAAHSDTVLNEWASRVAVPAGIRVREAPFIEVYVASRAAAGVIGTEAEESPVVESKLEEIAFHLEPALAQLDVDLVIAYRGAVTAIRRGGPDHGRHFAVSLRELLTQVLHRLAPDDAVRAWPETSAADYHNGRPTRRARLRYIFRLVADTIYEEFIDADITSALQIIDELNGDTHRPVSHATPQALRLTLRRVEGILAILLEATRLT